MIEWGMDHPAPNPLIAWMQSSARKSLPRAEEALVEIKERLGASWSVQSIPWQSLEKPTLLGLMLDHGLSLQRVDKHPKYDEHGLRGLALFLDAPLETYSYFDAAGIEEISEDTCSRIGVDVIRASRPNSLRALHKAHPEFIEHLVRKETSVICIGIIGKYLEAETKKNLEMVRLATHWGANWEAVTKQNGFITEKKQPVFDALVRNMQAERLAKSWEDAPVPTSRSRPRL